MNIHFLWPGPRPGLGRRLWQCELPITGYGFPSRFGQTQFVRLVLDRFPTCPRVRNRRECSSAFIESRGALWFSQREQGGMPLEEVRHLAQWAQTLPLNWFDDEKMPGWKFPR